MRKQRDRDTYHRKYHLPDPYSTRYARSASQARFRGEEWAFTQDTWYKVWQDSGVIAHMGRGVHQYCMTRVDNLEAWGPHNVIIIPRRMHFRKMLYEYVMKFPRTDYDPVRHGYYVPPETLEKYHVK